MESLTCEVRWVCKTAGQGTVPMLMIPIFKIIYPNIRTHKYRGFLIGSPDEGCAKTKLLFVAAVAKRQERRSHWILKRRLIRIKTTLSFCSSFFFFFLSACVMNLVARDLCMRGNFSKTPVWREQIGTRICSLKHVRCLRRSLKTDLRETMLRLNCETNWSLDQTLFLPCWENLGWLFLLHHFVLPFSCFPVSPSQ